MDKLVLLGCCLMLSLLEPFQWVHILAFLLAVILSALCSYFEDWRILPLSSSYCLLCLIWPDCFVFLPVAAYDISKRASQWFSLLLLIPITVQYLSIKTNPIWGMTLLFTVIAVILQRRTQEAHTIRREFLSLQDRAEEQSLVLKDHNRQLMEKQEYEIQLAMLGERNRIAREIHDNVGHLLTRSLLQISALKVLHKGEVQLQEEVSNVEKTLAEAMGNIRASVHDLHEESIDLRLQLQTLIKAFTFCPVRLHYDAGKLPKELKYCFLGITREALSNVARHSNAAQVYVTILEHPAFYQLVIQDNGTGRKKFDTQGIGLQNMEDRVKALLGTFRTEDRKGFRIFVSIPKEKESK